MNPYHLATKLHIPARPLRTVPRSHLINKLEQEIAHRKVVWVSAPAGYGKTTLLTQWAQESLLPVVWISVDQQDTSLDHFLRYLVTGWEQIQPDLRQTSLDILLSGKMPSTASVLSAFINIGSELSRDIVFVLDDFHLIEDAEIHQAFTFLLDHLPQKLHFVLTSRAEPALPLARYRARQELLDLHAEDLGFTLAETGDFLTETMGLDLDHANVARLHTQTEGWIAGLQLVALSLQRRHPHTDTGSALLDISGRHRFIADYLREDVLASLAAPVQNFLLQTSILDRLCGSLCNAVTENDESQSMLELLERKNLFLLPLDDSRAWFRYHPLFADLLRSELSQHSASDSPILHRRAARWYLDHDLPQQAFEHAIAGEDVALVIQIAERYLVVKLMSGEIALVKGWLESLPAAWYASHPEFTYFQASLMFFTGQVDACARCADQMERMVRAANIDMQLQLARVTAVRCFIACARNDLAPAEAFAGQALRDLPHDEFDIRSAIYGSLGDTYRRNGLWAKARDFYLRALELSYTPTFHIHSVEIFGALADLDLQQGHLQGAAAYWRRARQVIDDRENWGTFPLPLMGWVFIRMGEILYEQNELEDATDHISRGLARAELGGDGRAMIAGYVLAGRLKLTLGDLAGALGDLEQARLLVEGVPSTWLARFHHFQADCWMAQDRVHTAIKWANDELQHIAPAGQLANDASGDEGKLLAVAHVLIAKGDSTSVEQTVALLAHLLKSADIEGRLGIQIAARALLAMAHARGGDLATAMISLERALYMAEPEGYVRTFADLDMQMARLLQEAHARQILPAYSARLLTAFGVDSSAQAASRQALPEPLTAREQEVIQLIAAGLTGREIAEALIISPETVKKHTSNIYGKLGVSNRTEAAATARTLGLLR